MAGLQRRLNKLRFRTERKMDYLRALLDALKKIEKENKRAEKQLPSKAELKKRFLENEIHKGSLKVMEAEMVRSRLQNILEMLKSEKLGYTAALDELEAFIREQEVEISQLQKDYDEAMMYKEEMRLEMKEAEDRFQAENKERSSMVLDIKREMKEKRELFTAIIAQHTEGPVSKQPPSSDSGSVSGSVSSIEEKSEEAEDEEGEVEDNTTVSLSQFQDAFTRMARSAGVSEIEEVIDRFRTQQDTNKTLEEQSDQAEKDIRDMGQEKDTLEQEFQQTKFLGQDEDVGALIKLEKMSESITKNEERVETALSKITSLSRKQVANIFHSSMLSQFQESLRGCFDTIAVELSGEEQNELQIEALVQYCKDQVGNHCWSVFDLILGGRSV